MNNIIAKPADKLKAMISGPLCSHLNLVFHMFVTNYLCPNNTLSDSIHICPKIATSPRREKACLAVKYCYVMLSGCICYGLSEYSQGEGKRGKSKANRPHSEAVGGLSLALSSSRQEHLGSLLASLNCCPAVPSRHGSSVRVQKNRASEEGSHTDNCNTHLTLSLEFRESLGTEQEREEAHSSPN